MSKCESLSALGMFLFWALTRIGLPLVAFLHFESLHIGFLFGYFPLNVKRRYEIIIVTLQHHF